jgi:O-methyltransferase
MSIAETMKRLLHREEQHSGVAPTWRELRGFSHPERYDKNYSKYRMLGGAVNPEEDAEKFARGLVSHNNDMARFYSFCLIADQISKDGIDGDFAELGVWQGNTAELLAAFARRFDRTLYLLDTFEGLPEVDLGRDEKHLAGVFTDTSVEAVRARIGDDRVAFVKGYFPDTASQLPSDSRFALVHIDCDLYAPMLSALEYFYPRMSPGGFILMHDYSSLCWDGAEKAVDEFFADKPEAIMPLPDLAGTAVMRKNRR